MVEQTRAGAEVSHSLGWPLEGWRVDSQIPPHRGAFQLPREAQGTGAWAGNNPSSSD